MRKQIASAPPPVPVAADAASVNKGRRVASNPSSHPLAVQIVQEPGNELQYVANLAKPFLRPLAVFGMVLIFSLYLLIEHNDLRNRLFRLVGLQQINLMTQALNDATQEGEPVPDAPTSGERVLRSTVRNRLVSDWPSLRGLMGRGCRHLAVGPLYRLTSRRRSAFDAVSGGV